MRLIDADNVDFDKYICNGALERKSMMQLREELYSEINNQPTVNEWTLCSIKMPEVSDWYMVSVKDADMEIMAHYIKTKNKFEDRDCFGEMVEVQNVIAWRYRQPAYKED